MINRLVEHCDLGFNTGNACNNEACGTPKNCVNCLAAIHNGSGRDYDCDNMINHYVCTYIYKYSSEVAQLFTRFNNFQEMERLNILSIGCGPCSDLFAAYNTFNEKEINYHGFDLNLRWQPVHQKIEDIFTDQEQVSLNFHYRDVFQLFPELDFTPNVLVLSYLLSHIHRHGNMTEFLNDLKNVIIEQMEPNSIIIINDINHNTLARNHFGTLFSLLNQDDPGSFVNERFSYLGGWNYGVRIPELQLITEIPEDIRIRYQAWSNSTSAQMIIKKVR
ncbi:MAG: hypothetical protein HWE22_08455 [Flavobacteriales bacterium]|nr:hypothetical protein [Flavobacteriales bacterium]